MKTIVILLTSLFLSANVNAEPDKFYVHCTVKSFIDYLKLIDTTIYNAVENGMQEGSAFREGKLGSVCYRINVSSVGKETNISITLIENGFQYANCQFAFRKGKLETALVDVSVDDTERYVHVYIKGSKKKSYCRNNLWQFRSFSSGLFAEHLSKVTPL